MTFLRITALTVTLASALAWGQNSFPPPSAQTAPAITRTESITVTASPDHIDLLSPDPGEQVFSTQDLLGANPGRPGAPVSIPGYPTETASSGIKAPQYFAPGVAGDHGEPIAQFLKIGSFLLPNNLSANAHGNGYADPNILIPQILQSVAVDGGAFNVREGNHSVNFAATYTPQTHLSSFLDFTTDDRDLDLAAGFSPGPTSFIAVEGSYGNGLLERLEHRRQFKLNAQRIYTLQRHRLTLFGIAYYGFSYLPGLVPLSALDAGDVTYPYLQDARRSDTVDPRQRDQTHTALASLNDLWTRSDKQQLQVSGFLRTYNLSLFSNFGQGLIRQSEFRTVAGASADFIDRLSDTLSLLAGFDYDREAPRRDDLDHYDLYSGIPALGPFKPVDANNITIASYTPYAAASGQLTPSFRYDLGWRRDEIGISNQDLLTPANSSGRFVGLNSPKASVSFVPKTNWLVPEVSAAFGEAFFTEDPRIGLGDNNGSPLATAHSYELVAARTLAATELKLTLGHVTTSAELAKIDPDTGLQQNQGPGRLRFLTFSARHNFARDFVLATFSKADARDLASGLPTPEAPRTLFDLLGVSQRLPGHTHGKAELEYVGRKPLGTGCLPNPAAECSGTSVRELRLELARPFLQERLTAGVNALIGSGYTGQTTENFGASPLQEVVGVRIPSYAGVSLTWRFSPARPLP